ncbi:tRNA1(Val) (adenine(37)-N6)-methyltransferase [Gluconobacter sphaericus]|uniref:tRNA1(Val) (adenine(37)-N6)-methyltransferase n=1 Tax=Gluconobacter sphaericus TaxID=574987 RepID=UPI00157FF6E5|nr:SAM-dependent methyltransferase [Gluconobacter sphaericus]GBR52858.1 methyltransferase [Gluconobacter sphaericus NBRC 12467]
MSGSRKTVNPLPRPKSLTAPLSAPPTPAREEGFLLGGRVRYDQFTKGYRTGLEPVLMAASIPAKPGETVLEGGCGAGAALLCLSARIPGVHGVGLESDPETQALAEQNIRNNQLLENTPKLRILQAHLPAIPRSLRALTPTANGRFHHVMANPPWHSPSGPPSPDNRRRLALSAETTTPEDWICAMTKWVLPGGTLTFILSAAVADRACQTLLENGCGSIQLYPFWPRHGREAKLVLVRAVHGGRGIFRLRAGLVLHEADGRFTAAAERVLRDGEALPESEASP